MKSFWELEPTYDDEDAEQDEDLDVIIDYILNEVKENPYA